jgi:hypothetical protein
MDSSTHKDNESNPSQSVYNPIYPFHSLFGMNVSRRSRQNACALRLDEEVEEKIRDTPVELALSQSAVNEVTKSMPLRQR